MTPEQRAAACAHDGHARVLAGPGTGKTFTLRARVEYLIEELAVDPSRILVVTFTRKAVAELRERILPSIPEGQDPPRISTLHGFALRQLLRNAALVDTLPAPLRVADDWEEAEIIIPDLQRLLKNDKKGVKADLDAMSADWDTLTDAELNIDAQFIAAWRRVRDVYGFTLRAEMVYRLKRAMEQHDKFEVEGQFEHVIVDEFQDLNACDLAVIHSLGDIGASVFCAGDDDQSIYGFRQASPAGIRSFIEDYVNSEDHKVTLCKRCDRGILEAAEYVADQDLQREPKGLTPENDGGFVRLFPASDQDAEAATIAEVCRRLHADFAYPSIAILLRSDRHRRFSQPIVDALKAKGVPVSEHETLRPLSESATRRLYALAQLAVCPEDSLAVRTLLQLTAGIGDGCVEALEDLAAQRVERYSATVRAVAEDPTPLPGVGSRIARCWDVVETAVAELSVVVEAGEGGEIGPDQLRAALSAAAALLGLPSHAVDDIMNLVGETESASLSDLVSRSSTISEGLEPQLSADSVNIMTMHQAKGLTFDCVLIPGLEDELLPGKYDDPEQEGDQRRLLYVSMTRARHALVMFYARRRTGAQVKSHFVV
ncbi:MAG: ATP-dependent helicase [Thermoleophilia bacterium]|nr:ATP-dependent helicase [Thermoleophilia bacterium]